MKLLIVDGEKRLSNSIAKYMSQESFICEIADTASAADELLALYNYDCVILDVVLPDGDGMRLLEALKQQNKPEGVIIISGKSSLNDRIRGLDAGADDYLTKPFQLAELRSRVMAIIRRKNFNGQNLICFNELSIDIQAKQISVSGKLLNTTRKEFDLLLFLAFNRNRTVSKRAIAEHLSGDSTLVSNSYDFVYTHMKNLKKKLVEAGCADYIKTIHGLGYKIAV